MAESAAYGTVDVNFGIDLPGKFDSFLSGSSVAYSGDGYSDDPLLQAGAESLHTLYRAARRVKIGKGYAVRLMFDGKAYRAYNMLLVLDDYADSCVVANSDAVGEGDPEDRAAARAETAAARKVRERIQVLFEMLDRVTGEPSAS